jgi:hypothetical protein
MLLPIKSARDALNIDRFDKAFVWASLLLRQNVLSALNPANSGNNKNPYKDYISVGHDLHETVSGVKTAILKVKIQLPYDSQGFLGGGGNLIAYIKEVSAAYNPLISAPFFAAQSKTIAAPPSVVTSVEKYIYWCALNLLNATYVNSKNVIITLNEKNYPDNYVQIDVSLPLLINNFFSGLSYVDSLDVAVGASLASSAVVLPSGGTLNPSTFVDSFVALMEAGNDLDITKSANSKLLFKEKKAPIFELLKTILSASNTSGIDIVLDNTNSNVQLNINSEAIFQLVMSFLVESTGIDLIINDVTNRINIATETQTGIDVYSLLKGILINGSNTSLVFNDGTKKIAIDATAVSSGNVIAYDPSVSQRRKTATFTTAAPINDGAVTTGTINLARTFIIHSISTSANSRVRLYKTEAQRNNDLARPETSAITAQSGLITETIGNGKVQSQFLLGGSNEENIVNNSIPFSLTNKSGLASLITIEIIYTPIEF